MNKTWYRINAKANASAEITLYDEIGDWGVTAKEFRDDLKALGEVQNIDLHIHSPGGDVFDGMAIYNLLKNHSAKKTVYIDGLAASMASVIAMAGDTVIMPENTMMMIHKPWGIQGGDANDLRKYADLLDTVENTLTTAYVSKTGKSAEELAEMLSAETWLTARECVEHGFADQLAEPMSVMASLKSKKLEEYKNMPKDMKDKVTEQPTAVTVETPAEKPQAKAETVKAPEAKKTGDVLAAQKQRVESIKAVFAPFNGKYDSLQIECLGDISMTAEQAKDKLLAELGKGTTPSVSTAVYVSNGNIVGDSVKASLLARAGFETAEQGNAYNNMTLRELARASLADRGVGISTLNPMQMVGLAFTHSTSDFGQILIDVAHKSVLKGWAESTENFEQWTHKGSLTDFRPAYRVGLGGFDTLPQVREGAEYTYVTLGDTGTHVSLATYGGLFSLTRQLIINDDMHMLTQVPYKLGQAARATIADLVFAQLTGDPTMAYDGKKLYASDHKNTVTNGHIDITTIDKAIQLMNAQKSFDGKQLAIEPDLMLAPTSLYTKAKQVIGSSSVEGADINSGIINPLRDVVPVVKSQRLQAANEKIWYLINKEAIEVSYLNGVETPFIDQQTGFTVDGVTTKVRIDAGVNVLDHRGIVRVTNQ
ncbi:ATP-dependent Clp protease proteolytic subunit [Pasteurellaceae bacterium 20609_3]|uniref:ClpP-like prohead protease/major capsid protein fusion protein n=1 Tax=Spirabiliibacterium mucosae TaxID=28156 RepID=UPI001AAD6576|nr:ClpP-like prohead protease/major capsid protein fusion protein [Spirabiliibacterium mucosae]MBE2898090.1 ATP-dependent Clp protease proteolytic subunit [Spirabiliibacterium mucosae]